MSAVAWVVFSVFLIWVVGDGLKRTRGSKSLEDYYAGGRKIPWWAAGLSIMATQASAITVIGTTGQGHDGGLEFVQIYLGLPFAMIVASVVLIPLYRSQPILTAYQYLERRFDGSTRTLASLVFLVSRCLALGVVIQAPAIVLSAILGLQLETTIVVVGLLTTIYTTFGGVSAVVWTDVKQMVAILVGLLLCFGWLAWEVFSEIGLGGAISAAGAVSKLGALEAQPASTDLVPGWGPAVVPDGAASFWSEKYNLFSGLIGGFFLHLAYFGADQSQVQRTLTSPTANDSRKSLLMSAFVKVPMQLGVLSIGVLLWLFHALNPADAPITFDPEQRQAVEARAEQSEVVASLITRHEEAESRREKSLKQLAAEDFEQTSEDDLLIEYRGASRDVDTLRKIALLVGPSPVGSEKATKEDAKVSRALAAFDEGDSKTLATVAGKGFKDRNFVFPSWVLNQLPGWLVGLIVAAIFAAAMSSVDSVLNSLSAATTVDFVTRGPGAKIDPSRHLRIGRVLTFVWGLIATGTAIVLISGSSIIEQVNKIGSFFYGSLLGVFLLGAFCSWARGVVGAIGLTGGMITVLATWQLLKVEFLWFNVVGVVGVFGFAALARLLGLGRPTQV